MALQKINQTIISSIASRWVDRNKPQAMLDQLKAIKAECVKRSDQESAKQVWCLEQVVLVHKYFIEAFESIQSGHFYSAWCSLEKCEIRYGFVINHLEVNNENQYLLKITLETVKKFQSLFPYKLFISPGMLIKKTECTICGAVRSIRNPCGHEIGKIYDGEMCGRNIIDFQFLEMSFVTEPHQKYSVAFPSSPDGKKHDPYNYEPLKYLIDRLKSPYDNWDVKLTTKIHPLKSFNNLGRNDKCPCGSDKKFKKCCLLKGGIELPYYLFDLETIDDPNLATEVLHYKKGE